MMWTIHDGDWRKGLAPDPGNGELVIITDPPFDPRTHDGRETGSSADGITYAPLTKKMVRDVVNRWVPHNPEFFVLFCSHTTFAWFEAELQKAGQLVFPPVPWVKTDPTPRKTGDGPVSACEWLCIARRRKRLRRMGQRPGYYFEPVSSVRGQGNRGGQKPLPLCRKIVLDYSEPGDTILDLFMGYGNVSLAACMEGRNAWSAEIDEATADIARQKRDAFNAQPALPGVSFTRPKQVVMPLTTSECPTSDYCERTDHSNC